MEHNATYQITAPEDALWTLYRQQTLKVRHAFLSRIRTEDLEVTDIAQMPWPHDSDEMKAASRQRMRDIMAGHEQTLSHEEALQLIDRAIAQVL